MANLVVLTLGDGRTFRCADLDDAKEKAIRNQVGNDMIFVEIIPENGGPMISLGFDKISQDWIAIS